MRWRFLPTHRETGWRMEPPSRPPGDALLDKRNAACRLVPTITASSAVVVGFSQRHEKPTASANCALTIAT